MRRRKIAKNNLPGRVRAWVTAFRGQDLVREYRKRYHASWSCAIVELGMAGVSFSAEDVAEAQRRQVASRESIRVRKAEAAERAELPLLREQYGDAFFEQWNDPAAPALEHSGAPRNESGARQGSGPSADDYDPFAD